MKKTLFTRYVCLIVVLLSFVSVVNAETPIYSSINVYPVSPQYTPVSSIWFNITWNETNTTKTLYQAIIRHNFTGSFLNYTMSPTINNNLIGYWKFDENTGTNAYDSSIYENTSTLSNSPSWVTGKYNYALSFNGINNSVRVGSTTDIFNESTFANGLTMSAWIYPISYKTSRIIDIEARGGLIEFDVTQQKVRFYTYDNDYQYSGWSNTITLNNWHLVTGVWNTTHNLIYVDGVLQNSGIANNCSSIDDVNRYTAIGSQHDGTSNYFNGTIDDPRIYNRPLSTTDILSLYQLTNPNSISYSYQITNQLAGIYNYTFYANNTLYQNNNTATYTYRIRDGNLTYCDVLDKDNYVYYVQNNISSSVSCMSITGNNVTLDCQNYALIGSNNGSSIGIDVLNNNFAIKNCIVTNFGTAIGDGSTNGQNGTINNTQTLNNNYGIVLYGVTGNQNNINISYSLMNNNTGCGVRTIKVNNINVRNSVLTNNGLTGVTGGLCSCDSQNISLSNSSINYNRWGLVMSAIVNIACSGDGNLHSLTYSNVSSNNYVGIGMTGNLTIIGNIINNNTFVVDGVTYANISKNVFQNNAYSMQIKGISNAYLYNNIFNTTSYFNCLNCNSNLTYFNISLQSGSSIIPNFSYIGGNYWSNSSKNGYSDTCLDYDYNGFCDVNYTINAGTDWLPLSLYAYNQSLIPDTRNLTISALNTSCGVFVPNLGNYTYAYGTLTTVNVYPICNFTGWLLNNGTVILSNNFNLVMNNNYIVTAYFGSQSPYTQNSSVGGGIAMPTDSAGFNLSWLNPFFSGYFILGLFNIGIAGFSVYQLRGKPHSLEIGIGVFLLIFLAFLFGGFYPPILWSIVIFSVAIIITMIVAKIGSGE